MIELVVAATIFAIVLACAATGFLATHGANEHLRAGRAASQQAGDALELLQRDLRAAASPDAAATAHTRDDLRSMLLWGVPRAGDSTAARLQPDDCNASASAAATEYCREETLTVANDHQLWFRADVRSTGPSDTGSECVRWEVTTTELVRIVHARRTDPTSGTPDCRPGALGPQLDRSVLLATPSSSTGRPATFAYLTRWNRVASAAAPGTPASPADCDTRTVTSPAGRDRTFVTNVGVRFSSVATRGAAAAQTDLRTSVTIATRSTDEHTFAAGCSF